jgi:aryl-alcohol dehydrogenase-like predicted oxidoreductase
MATASDDLEEAPARRAIERNFRVVDAAEAIAADRGATVAQVAIAWLTGVEGVVAPILGPRTMAHLDDLLGAADLELSADERVRLEAPAPPPDLYPNRMLTEQVGLDVVTGPLRRP